MSPISHQFFVFETACGPCAIAWNDVGITRFHLPSSTAEAATHSLLRRLPGALAGTPPIAVRDAIHSAQRYFEGNPIDFSDVRLDLEGQGDFFQRIYALARQIGWGKTTTYGGLAKDAGVGPEMAREVGQAMAKNPVPLIIPCHRVLAAGGKLGGFSAPGGSSSKRRMLELEGIRLAPPEPVQQSLGL